MISKLTMSLDKTSDKRYIIIMMAVVVFASIAVALVPTTYNQWDEGTINWHRSSWFYGGYFQYDRIPDNDIDNIYGQYSSADGFSLAIPILMGIALVLPSISVFFIGKNRWQSFTFQRIFASLITLGSIMGIISTVLFGIFSVKQTADPYMTLYIGFYVSAVYFGLLFIASLLPIITSNQIPKPKITPPPPQEGELMDEEKKLKKKRKLFEHLEEIEETADEEY